MRIRPATARLASALLIGLTLTSMAWAFSSPDERRFPHEKHTRLFPTCTGCHEGAIDEARGQLYPPAELCARCHNGQEQKRVDWTGPLPDPSNLKFSHAEHNREANLGDPALNCQQCHANPGATTFMAVSEARPDQCISCHGHRATAHLAEDSPCATCHVPLAQATELPDSAIAGFPLPPSHRRPNFVVNHGPDVATAQAQCATCHARESCERCHANAGSIQAIAALGRDPRIDRVFANRAPVYPVPPSHTEPGWPFEHGDDARARIATCANCHAQPSCTACHIGPLGQREIRRLPDGEGGARGVRLEGRDARPMRPPSAGDDTRPTGPTTPPSGVPAASGMQGAPRARPVVPPDTSRPAPRGASRSAGGGASSRTLAAATFRYAMHSASGAVVPTPVAAGLAPVKALVGGPGAAMVVSDTDSVRVAPPARGQQQGGQVAQGQAGATEVRVHPPGFATNHGASAASRQLTCTGCHERKFCADCHDGEGRRRFHAQNYVARHPTDAYGRQRECSQCHNQETFCRSCHEASGLQSKGRLNTAFHTGQPLWLLQHAQAARQGLEGCTTCHTQQDCMQCHSTVGWSVSPHGRDFDAARMEKRNPSMCRACHLGSPTGRRGR